MSKDEKLRQIVEEWREDAVSHEVYACEVRNPERNRKEALELHNLNHSHANDLERILNEGEEE